MFSCELCKKSFKQKGDYAKHKNRKAPCISLDKIQSLTTTKTDTKGRLKTTFDYCLDVLRSEHLTGDKALRSLSYLLNLRLLEPRLVEIGIDSYEYDFSSYEDGADRQREGLLRLSRFSNLMKEKEDNLPVIMKCLWEEILSEHPITKNIFVKGRSFEIQHQSTFKKLIHELGTVDFDSMDEDILGEAYEEVIKDVMIGKTLGQFFTPPKVKQMMVHLIDPQLKLDGTTEIIFDPAMGTGGFLITCFRNLLKQSKAKDIPLNWDFLSQEGLGGREAEPDTYQLAVSNMLIASGKMFQGLEKGDSIRDPITNKYDIILANPPFGIDGLTYAEISHPLRDEYMPISSNSAVPLFLQAIIHTLKMGGRCAVVLPEGQELFSKSKALVAVREYLMKTCDLKEVIYLPAGTFTHTPIRTCVFYFHKKREGPDVLETNLKHSRTTQKETERTYVFSRTHQTHKVKFYDYNTENDTKHLLLEVDVEDLAENNYSLNYAEYLKDDTADDVYEDGIIVKNLAEICKFLPKSKRQASYGEKDGQYAFYTSSQTCSKYCHVYDYEEECLIIGTGGTANVKYGKQFSCSTDNFVISMKGDISTKYVYYYLLNNLEVLQRGFVGIGIQHLSKEYLSEIKIPIPSIEIQQEIVEYLDFVYERSINTSTEKILELKQLNQFCLKTQKVFGENMVKTLGEVCKIKCGNHSTKKSSFVEGPYLIIGGGKQPIGTHNEYNCDENTVLCASHGTAGHISMYPVKTFLTMAFAFMEDPKILHRKYFYYYLKSIEDHLVTLGKGTAQPCISMNNLKEIKIPIPPLGRQQEIIEYCDFNVALSEELKKEMEQNKKQAKLFMMSFVSATTTTEKSEGRMDEKIPQSDLRSETSVEAIHLIEEEIPLVAEEKEKENEVKVCNEKKREIVTEPSESSKKTKFYPIFSKYNKK
jgi:type I restriction-modification system DNA methylase subunit